MSGERISTKTPYGYLRDSEGHLSVDPETAPVVRLIFQMSAEGNGPRQNRSAPERAGDPYLRGCWLTSGQADRPV